ncbi:cationic amino acid transporter 3-like [Drosophila navojoa]|nr:cationic amino acid transporter 3-like [Drosophila navojoa]
MLRGVAICFFGFVGFDCITSTAGEAINPTHNIPMAIFATMLIVFCTYFLMSTILTLMVPYYLINPITPLTSAFQYHKMYHVQTCVTVGSVLALSASLLNSMFPLQRILRAMAQNGFMLKGYASVKGWTKSTMLATFLFTIIAAGTLVLHFEFLIQLSVMGVLLDYTIVAFGVVLLHYKKDRKFVDGPVEEISFKAVMRQICSGRHSKKANIVSDYIARLFLIIFVVFSGLFCLAFKCFTIINQLWAIVLASCSAVLSIVCIIIIGIQPKSSVLSPFETPLVPLIPCISIWVNIFLVSTLSWLCLAVYLTWMIVGYAVYFGVITADFLGKRLIRNMAKQMIDSFKFLV